MKRLLLILVLTVCTTVLFAQAKSATQGTSKKEGKQEQVDPPTEKSPGTQVTPVQSTEQKDVKRKTDSKQKGASSNDKKEPKPPVPPTKNDELKQAPPKTEGTKEAPKKDETVPKK